VAEETVIGEASERHQFNSSDDVSERSDDARNKTVIDMEHHLRIGALARRLL